MLRVFCAHNICIISFINLSYNIVNISMCLGFSYTHQRVNDINKHSLIHNWLHLFKYNKYTVC